MNRLRAFLAVVLLGVVAAGATTTIINVSGKVTNTKGTALSASIVTIGKVNLSTTTDAAGTYKINQIPVVHGISGPINQAFSLRNGYLFFSLTGATPVRVDLYGMTGKLMSTPVAQLYPAGSFRIPVSTQVKGSICLLKATLGTRQYVCRFLPMINIEQTTAALSARTLKRQALVMVDTIRASKAGYQTKWIPMDSYTGTINFVLDSLSDGASSAITDGSADRLKQYGVTQYFWGTLGTGVTEPLTMITHAVSPDAVDVAITFSPHFVDNTYGTGQVGWNPRRGHTFRDLYVSDHVEIKVLNGAGEVVFYGKLDLLSSDSSVSSGYASLGPFGGDGVIYQGDPTKIISYGSSLDDNINYYGYRLFENSPATDSTMKVNPQYPYWQYYTTYRISFDPSIFGPSGYGKVEMTTVHASPSKDGLSTINVTEKPAPVPGSPQDPYRYLRTFPATPPDTSSPPDTSNVPPDTGNVPPDTGNVPPDTGTPPDTGNVPPDTGNVPPDTGGGVD